MQLLPPFLTVFKLFRRNCRNELNIDSFQEINTNRSHSLKAKQKRSTYILTKVHGQAFEHFFLKLPLLSIAVTSNLYRICNLRLYSRLSLSQNRRYPLKHFEISILRHIRFIVLRKKIFEQPQYINDYII